MSHSSSATKSSSPGGGGGGAGYDGQEPSPVPYRVGPLEYEPNVECKCVGGGIKACRWISWSNGQPGRRYYRCRKAKTRGDCGYFSWSDPECSEWLKELLGDLRDTVWNLKKLLAKMEEKLEEKELQLEAKQREIDSKNQCFTALAVMLVIMLVVFLVFAKKT